MSGIKMYCQSCGWSYEQFPSSAPMGPCPQCFGSWFGSEPRKPWPFPIDESSPAALERSPEEKK